MDNIVSLIPHPTEHTANILKTLFKNQQGDELVVFRDTAKRDGRTAIVVAVLSRDGANEPIHELDRYPDTDAGLEFAYILAGAASRAMQAIDTNDREAA